MTAILDDLYATYGITRLGEGGMVSNVPARVAWETAASGRIANGRRNVFVVALDCFAPSPNRPAWLLFQQALRQANVQRDRAYADKYRARGEPIHLIGVEWSREGRNIVAFEAQHLEPAV